MVILHSTLPRSQSARRPDPNAPSPTEPSPTGPSPTAPSPDGSAPQAAVPEVSAPTGTAAFAPPKLRLVGDPAVGASDDRPRREGRLVSRAGRGTQVLRDAGMATAEYAIATLAAVGFAGLLLVVLRSGEVRSLLMGLIKRALSVSA